MLGGRSVSVGQYVSPQTTLVSIYAMDRMKLNFTVPERCSGKIVPGQTLALSVSAYPDQTFSGEIYLIEPQIDIATRTLPVRAHVPNSDHRLKPGMFANVTLNLGTKQNALTIPEDCLFPHEGGFAVYRATDGILSAVTAAGPLNPKEVADMRASADVLQPVADASGGSTHWLEDGVPEVRRVDSGDTASGSNWIGLNNNGAYRVTALEQQKLLPQWLALLLIVGALLLAWRLEGR